MSGALLYIALGILKLSGPGGVWGICQLLVGEEGVVVTDIAVGIDVYKRQHNRCHEGRSELRWKLGSRPDDVPA